MVSRRIDFCVLLVYTVSERFFRLRRSTAAFYAKGVIAFFFFFFEDEQNLNDLINDLHKISRDIRKLLPVCDEYQRSCIDTRIRELENNYKLFTKD